MHMESRYLHVHTSNSITVWCVCGHACIWRVGIYMYIHTSNSITVWCVCVDVHAYGE